MTANDRTKLQAVGIGFGGMAVAGAVGALAWKKHRGWGALIGALLVGPFVGGAMMVAFTTRKQPEEEKKPQNPLAAMIANAKVAR